MSESFQGEGFTIKVSKFDFFFGRVSSTPENERRSRDNCYGLRQLGIEGDRGTKQLMQIFQKGLTAPQVGGKRDRYGITIVRKVEVIGPQARGAIEISYLYRHHDFQATPEVTTLIPKIYT